ncbi:hypothetical protein [Streptomyces sp. YIM 121038]|uniref:hypothetical protein n=1 Tax=Streptomyces sp. YIM 121038 TaxID=2136401 RepID=UPI0011105458|nr:hypothetical protein [Streptomyces sp. YIM 121038]
MSPEERRRFLGDDVIAHIHAVVDAAPEPSPEVVAALRRIFANPAGEVPGGEEGETGGASR